MDVMELLQQVQTAYADVKSKQAAADAAANAHAEARKAYGVAADKLRELQSELNEMLGTVAPDSRFRQSA